MKSLWTMLLWLGITVGAAAQTGSSAVYISLLTCSPGTEPYTLFGHTAIHMRCDTIPDFDYVFNYGLFDYRSDNFIYRFVKGETDYQLGAEPTDFFMSRYVDFGHTVWEQELNLTAEERQQLFELILWNARPENKTYRYNFLYDNCTTRARDALQRALGEISVVYPADNEQLTFRQIIHQYTTGSPWVAFGIDLVLGSEIDRPLTARDKLFVPSRYHDALQSAHLLLSDGTTRPLLRDETIHTPDTPLVDRPAFPFSPLQVMTAVFILTCLVSAYDWHRRCLSRWLDILLLGTQAIAGLLVAFLFFFSQHPAVGTNWLIILFNPLCLFCLFKPLKPLYRYIDYVNLAGLSFTLLLFLLPIQQLPLALLPLVLSLFLRAIIRLK